MSNDGNQFKRDPQVAQRLREDFIANEGTMLDGLRDEMRANPGQFLTAVFGEAYNYVPYPDFDTIGPDSALRSKARVRVALEGLGGVLAEHDRMAAGHQVLLLEPGDEQLLLEGLVALRERKAQALHACQSVAGFKHLTEGDFGIPQIQALTARVLGELPSPVEAVDIAASRTGEDQVERVYSSAARMIEVELAGGQKGTWLINPGLTTRHGELENDMQGPEAQKLRDYPTLMERLREQMHYDMSFIGLKDGNYGVLYESEFPVIGDDVLEDQDALVDRELMLDALRLQAKELADQYPAVEFALIPEAEAAEGRPGLWAWVKDGAMRGREVKALASHMLEMSGYLDEAAKARSAPGL